MESKPTGWSRYVIFGICGKSHAEAKQRQCIRTSRFRPDTLTKIAIDILNGPESPVRGWVYREPMRHPTQRNERAPEQCRSCTLFHGTTANESKRKTKPLWEW